MSYWNCWVKLAGIVSALREETFGDRACELCLSDFEPRPPFALLVILLSSFVALLLPPSLCPFHLEFMFGRLSFVANRSCGMTEVPQNR